LNGSVLKYQRDHTDSAVMMISLLKFVGTNENNLKCSETETSKSCGTIAKRDIRQSVVSFQAFIKAIPALIGYGMDIIDRSSEQYVCRSTYRSAISPVVRLMPGVKQRLWPLLCPIPVWLTSRTDRAST